MRIIYALIVACPFVAACENDGPFERAGEEIDEAVENVQTDGETFRNRVDDAIDETRDGIEDATEELGR